MTNIRKYKNIKLSLALATLGVMLSLVCALPVYALNTNDTGGGTTSSGATATQQSFNIDNVSTQHQCGSGDGAVKTSINFGCKGESCLSTHPDPNYCARGVNASGILDVTFAIIRFLSYGVGLVIIASLVVAGIQYTTSQGDPKASAMAQERIKSTVIALIIFIFGYAILDYILPAGFLK